MNGRQGRCVDPSQKEFEYQGVFFLQDNLLLNSFSKSTVYGCIEVRRVLADQFFVDAVNLGILARSNSDGDEVLSKQSANQLDPRYCWLGLWCEYEPGKWE